MIGAVEALGDATADLNQTLEDLLRAAQHAWDYFRDNGNQDWIRRTVYSAMAKVLARVSVVPEWLYHRLFTELNVSDNCPNGEVKEAAKAAREALVSKKP